jgi:hypothetical protein
MHPQSLADQHLRLFTTVTSTLIALGLAACGETVTLESGKTYELPSDFWFTVRNVLAWVIGVVSGGICAPLMFADRESRTVALCVLPVAALLTWVVYPGSESPSEAALAAAKAEDAGVTQAQHDDPAYQKRIASETLERVIAKRDTQLKPEQARQQGLYTTKRTEVTALMAKTHVASHEELLKRATESVELLRLKNLIEEAAMAQRAAGWLAGKINQHDLLAEQLRSQVERLDSVVSLRGVASPEELKEIRSVVNGAVAAVEESLSVPEREDDAALAAKLFAELKSTPAPTP